METPVALQLIVILAPWLLGVCWLVWIVAYRGEGEAPLRPPNT